jgi:hypothetical protein
VGTPASYRPDVDLTVINGIGWFGDERPDDIVYTAVSREPRVAVAVPRAVGSSFEILVDLSDAVTKHTTGPNVTAG